jgi:pimeloyl-ACP methyl ester carboxylesterase
MKYLFTLTVLFAASVSFAQVISPGYLESKAATVLAMKDLKINEDSVPQISFQEIQSTDTSDRISLTLTYPDLPEMRVYLSGPKGFLQKTDRSMPALFLIAGFFTGAYNSLLLGEVPNMVVMSLDYPYPLDKIAQDPAKLLQSFRVTPGLIALSLKWLSQQPWVNPDQTLAAGVSLGGLFLPAGLKMAQRMNAGPARTIFAFTGANIKTILGNLLAGALPDPVIQGLTAVVPSINALNEPKLHLPYLKGNFLVIHASEDQIIPPSTTQELYGLLPETKTDVLLPGPHLDYDHNLQIQQIKDAILNWLKISL